MCLNYGSLETKDCCFAASVLSGKAKIKAKSSDHPNMAQGISMDELIQNTIHWQLPKTKKSNTKNKQKDTSEKQSKQKVLDNP